MNLNFPMTSRYYNVDTAIIETADGQEIIYLRRRFVPSPDNFTLLQEHIVKQGERVDHIAAQHLGDPEQFWWLCDANGVLDPAELLSPLGRHVRITLPEGIPGMPNA